MNLNTKLEKITMKDASLLNNLPFLSNAHSKNNLAEACEISGTNGECVNDKHTMQAVLVIYVSPITM